MVVETYTPDNLETGLSATITRTVTVESGQNLKRGQAVKIASGKVSELLTTETFYGVMNADCDATSGDTNGTVIYNGALLESEIIFTSGDSAEFIEAARTLGITFVQGA